MVLQTYALSVGEREQLVVVHHTVHVLHPHCIHIAIKDQVPVHDDSVVRICRQMLMYKPVQTLAFVMNFLPSMLFGKQGALES